MPSCPNCCPCCQAADEAQRELAELMDVLREVVETRAGTASLNRLQVEFLKRRPEVDGEWRRNR